IIFCKAKSILFLAVCAIQNLQALALFYELLSRKVIDYHSVNLALSQSLDSLKSFVVTLHILIAELVCHGQISCRSLLNTDLLSLQILTGFNCRRLLGGAVAAPFLTGCLSDADCQGYHTCCFQNSTSNT